jgi:hypothetical protein
MGCIGRCHNGCVLLSDAQKRVLEQATFYGIDGECLACPGISTSPPRSTTISNCECPVSPQGLFGPTVRGCNFHELRSLLRPSVISCQPHEFCPPSSSLPRSTLFTNCACPVSPSSPRSPGRPYRLFGPSMIRCNPHELRPILMTSRAAVPFSACAWQVGVL